MSAPWNHSLPAALTVGGEDYAIRSDYRVALDIFLALTDPEITDGFDRAATVMKMLYVDFDAIPPGDWQEAVNQAVWYLNGGEQERKKNDPRLVAWEEDFQYIASPISKIVGQDIRGIEYDRETNTGGWHWWSFLSAYQSIGDCFFAQIVAIRDKKAHGKKLDKADREFYNRHRDLIDAVNRSKITDAELEDLKEWM